MRPERIHGAHAALAARPAIGLTPAGMILLAIDTALASCSAALHSPAEDRILAAEQQAMDKGHAEAIAPMVQRVLAAAGLLPHDVTCIAVTTGPGTFTGLRIGLSLAHGMATALHCPAVGIDTLTATAAPLLAAEPDLLVVHKAGATGQFYAARLVNGVTGPLLFDGPDAVLALAENGTPSVIGTGADDIVALARTALRRLTGYDLPAASGFARLAATRPATDALPQPLYLREPDARPQPAFAAETIRLATLADIPALARLHRMCFEAGWSDGSLGETLSSPGVTSIMAERDGAPRAFLVLRSVAGEAEILTLCTAPHWRRRALAGKLLEAALEMLRAQNVLAWHLEVAADNGAAIALYGSHGFRETGRRKGYYARHHATPCDAILMTRTP